MDFATLILLNLSANPYGLFFMYIEHQTFVSTVYMPYSGDISEHLNPRRLPHGACVLQQNFHSVAIIMKSILITISKLDLKDSKVKLLYQVHARYLYERLKQDIIFLHSLG